jgi:hypothetical protein
MARRPTFRQMLLSILSLRYNRSQKEIGAASGIPQKQVSYYLRSGDLKDEVFERLLAGLNARPGAVSIVTGCVEALEALEQEGDLTEEERAQIEEAVLAAAEMVREDLIEALQRARALPDERYPKPADLGTDRWRAEDQWKRLQGEDDETASAAVAMALEFQNWFFCEKVCEESVRAASRKVDRAATLARLAQDIAARVRGPEAWCNRLRGYAAAHAANALRVAGHLNEADATLEEAKRLWQAGSDPDGVLDPGRLLQLEAPLRRDQRRFEEALARLDEAVVVSRSPESALINKGFTLEVIGEYERAVEVLLQAAPRVDRRAQPRLWNVLCLNLSNNFCFLGRHREAAELVKEVRPHVAQLGDEIDLTRILWLEARIAAGLGRNEEARNLFVEARRRFEVEEMSYDVALALLEEAVLLLQKGQTTEVKGLAKDLTKVFKAKGVHREALAALRLFQEAVERDTATAEWAQHILKYLYRAQYDQGLRFSSS